MNHDLPQGWTTSSIGEVASRVVVGYVGPSRKHYESTGIPFLMGKNVRANRLLLHDLERVTREFHGREKKSQLAPNDVVVVRIGRSGTAAVVPETLGPANCGGLVVVKNPRSALPSYVAHYLNSPAGQAASLAEARGVTRQTLNTRSIEAASIPLAPLAEQLRIVSKLEKLLSKVDACQERLEKISALLKRFRQSVLAAACSGRLTAGWRGNASESELQPPEPASPRAVLEVEGIVDVPESWRWLPLASLCDPSRSICYGVIKLGEEYPGGVPCLRTSDVKPLRIETAEVKRIAPEIATEYRRTALRGGEVLVNVRGTLGGVAVVPRELSEWNISREVALVPVQGVAPGFVAFWIASVTCQNWLTGVAKGVAYTGINIEDLKGLPIALPSFAEQQKIVQRVEGLFALADQIEAQFRAAQAQVHQLTPAVLARAFSGELVPTEASLATREGRTYETADDLLKRIRATRDRQHRDSGGIRRPSAKRRASGGV